MRKPWIVFLFIVIVFAAGKAGAQQTDAAVLYEKLRSRVFSVKDYTADVILHIDVPFMRVPQLKGKLYYKSPGKLKLVRQGGLSILPRRTVSMSLAGLLPDGAVTVIDAGRETLDGKPLRILKVVPERDGADIILTKLWVDEASLLIRRSEATTRDNGTATMDLHFGPNSALALPDEMTLLLDVKDYKMPKGLTMDYDAGATPAPAPDPAKAGKRKKGKIRIEYLHYDVNTGLSDSFFEEKKK